MRDNALIISALAVHSQKSAKKNRKKLMKNLVEPNKSSTFATANEKYNISIKKIIAFRFRFGVLTERLGNGLQNRVERFDSARHLQRRKFSNELPFLFS